LAQHALWRKSRVSADYPGVFINAQKKLLSMLSIAYVSLLTIFFKIGSMFFPSQVHIFFLGRIANVCSVVVDEAHMIYIWGLVKSGPGNHLASMYGGHKDQGFF
jgi:hypothetical protein